MMSKIKVVFSIGAMHGGGSERQLVSLLQNIDRDRIEPLVYLVYRTGPLLQEIPSDIPVASFEDRFGAPRGPGFLMHRKRVHDMADYLEEVNADVSYDRTFLMTLIAADAAQRSGIPNVSTIVTNPPVGFPQVAGRFQSVKRRMLGKLYRNSACVLANSQGAARSAERFYRLPERMVQVHYNGVDFDSVQNKAEVKIEDEWWNSSAQSSDVFRIVTAGRLDDKKGFHLLIDAVADLLRVHPWRKIHLAILGDGPCRQRLQNQINSLQLENEIHLTGFQQNAPAWYQSADLFVLPSLLEGMPNVLLEAMACGTAVVSTDCEFGPREILGDGEFGELCKVGSRESLVSAIQKLMESELIRTDFARRGKEHVQQKFAINKSVGELEDILLRVASR